MQHVEEAAHLRQVRSVLVRAPHVQLHRLARLDERLAAHLDGLEVAGRFGSDLCTAGLERPGAGQVFAVALRALDQRDGRGLDRLIALGEALPEARRGLLSAFGWMSAPRLQGIVRSLLAAPDAARREFALSACRLHRADPGSALMTALRDASPPLRASALRAAGELGRVDALPQALAALHDPSPGVAFWGAVSACLLGDRGAAPAALEALAQQGSVWRDRALSLALCAGDCCRGRDILGQIAQAAPAVPGIKRLLVRAFGWLGDVQSVPWLIELMTDDAFARVAGESFALITGADIAMLDLERATPEGLEAKPNDHPVGNDVTLDEDESLPWPDPDLIQHWWRARIATMPSAVCSFMGAPSSPEHCTHVLRTGGQRQRAVAAVRLCLANPGTPLFNVCAPSWRQHRQLAMS
jgi:uncharacterized protein (TIGR02270 family)